MAGYNTEQVAVLGEAGLAPEVVTPAG